MRLWSLHPRYLDPTGLVACWREALLARKVLCGATRGYRQHPQLERFRRTDDPVGAIDAYLLALYDEACQRGYRFDRSKIGPASENLKIPVHSGQLAYETDHLKEKLKQRHPESFKKLISSKEIGTHPLFEKVEGGVEPWEIRK